MGGGWAKVLIREDWIVQGADGVDTSLNEHSGQYWFFANCYEGLVASGYRSDRSDAGITSIYTAEGRPKDFTAAHNLYDRWKFLCDAVGLR